MRKITLIATIAATFALASMPVTAPKQNVGKPFLILGKMPHLIKLVKQNWDNLGLSKEQKEKLMQIKNETVKSVKTLQPKITKLENEVAKAAINGTKPEALKAKVDEIAKLKTEATMAHLKCIYNVKNILTPKQLAKIIKK